jgi:hypothetical protein
MSFRLRGCRNVSGEWFLVCLALDFRRMHHDLTAWETA